MSDAQAPPDTTPPPSVSDLPHDSLRNNIYISSALCWAIAAFFVGLRFYARGVIIRVLGSSDWSILLGLIFAGATSAAIIEQAVHGAGRHIWDLDPSDTPSAIAWTRAAWYGILFYLLSLCFTKISILLLYIHLFAFKWARWAGQVLLAVVIITNVYMVAVTFTACIPVRAYWDFTAPRTYCHPQRIWWSNTGLHMATDFLIFLLPMPVVWTIKLPRRQKLILLTVFGFGFLVCFISILRLLQLLRAQTDPDFTYAAAELSYLTAVEVNGAIVCACVMTLKPLLSRFFPRFLFGSTREGSGSGPGPGPGSGRSGPGYHYRSRRNRGSDTFVGPRGGPPTIGSLPSKLRAPLGALERDVWIEAEGVGGGGAVGKRGRGYYVELEDGQPDVWGLDVELVEHANPRRKREASGEGGKRAPVEPGRVRVDTEVTVEVSRADK